MQSEWQYSDKCILSWTRSVNRCKHDINSVGVNQNEWMDVVNEVTYAPLCFIFDLNGGDCLLTWLWVSLCMVLQNSHGMFFSKSRKFFVVVVDQAHSAMSNLCTQTHTESEREREREREREGWGGGGSCSIVLYTMILNPCVWKHFCCGSDSYAKEVK